MPKIPNIRAAIGRAVDVIEHRIASFKKSRMPFEEFGAGFRAKGIFPDVSGEALSRLRGTKEKIRLLVRGQDAFTPENAHETAIALRRDARETMDVVAPILQGNDPRIPMGKMFSRMTRRGNDAVRHDVLPDILQQEIEQAAPVTRSQVARLLKERRREGVEIPDSVTIYF